MIDRDLNTIDYVEELFLIHETGNSQLRKWLFRVKKISVYIHI
jgi:hypothetical protein